VVVYFGRVIRSLGDTVKSKSDATTPTLSALEKTILKDGLPASLEAERGLLGAILLTNNLIPVVLEKIHPDDFVSPAHQRIFNAIKDLHLHGVLVDIVSLSDRLKKNQGGLAGIGGIETLSNMMEGIPILTSVDHYIDIIKEKSVLRKLVFKSLQIIDSIYNPQAEMKDTQSILTSAEKAILEVGEETLTSSLSSLQSFSTQMMSTIDGLVKKGEHVTGVSTRFKLLDNMTSGLQKKDLILLAARPSVGKTAFALSLAMNAAKDKRPTALFSLEMSREQIFFRLLSIETHIELQKIRTGHLSKEHITKISRTIDVLSQHPIYIDDNPSVSVLDIGAKLRRLKASQKVDLVIIDYLQLMSGKGLEGASRDGRFESRNQEVASISRALKMLAKELDLPIVALSQLSRAPEKRGEGGTPVLSDLRDSGSLEQDADLVLFLHREAMYSKENKEQTKDERAKAKLIIAKQRNGPTGSIDLNFLEPFAQFTSYDPYEY
jgi:replicative DNA helicase